MKKTKKMHDTRVPRPLEVPPTRAHGARTGRAALAAPKKKMQEGGLTFGVWTRLFRGGGGRTPAHLFRRGGSKIYYVEDLTVRKKFGPTGFRFHVHF